MQKGNTNPLLYVIATLLLINLLATFWLINKVSEAPRRGTLTSAEEQLPQYITKEARKQIYEDFKAAFNSKDAEAFWNLFSDYARSQMDRSTVNKSYQQTLDWFGEVKDGTFSHYEYVTSRGNQKIYHLYYMVTLSEKSKFGTRGELKITITDDGQEYGILSGFLQGKTQ